MLQSTYKEFWLEGYNPGVVLVQFGILCVPFISPKGLAACPVRPVVVLHGLNIAVAFGALLVSMTTAHAPQGTPYLVAGQFFAFGVGYCLLQYRALPKTVGVLTHVALAGYVLPLVALLYLVVTR